MYKDEYLKDYYAMDNLILKYHPDFIDRTESQKTKLLEDALRGYYNTELIIEELVSIKAKIERTNDIGMDLIDGSDVKFNSVYMTHQFTRPNLKRWCISNVQHKKGWLRVVIFKGIDIINKSDTMAYFNIPIFQSDFYKLKLRKTKSNMKIQGVYRKEFDTFDGIEQFRVNGFEDICESVEKMNQQYEIGQNTICNFFAE